MPNCRAIDPPENHWNRHTLPDPAIGVPSVPRIEERQADGRPLSL